MHLSVCLSVACCVKGPQTETVPGSSLRLSTERLRLGLSHEACQQRGKQLHQYITHNLQQRIQHTLQYITHC